MPVREFPDPESARPNGLLAVGGDLHPESLLLAYRNGVFPWPTEEHPLVWFSPPRRGVLEFDRLHVPRSLAKARRRARREGWTITRDRAFREVIEACAVAPRPGQHGTWITVELIEAYCELHRLGHARSLEVWAPGNRLVGGIYGVDAGGAFSAESMFHLETNASKIALLALVDHLRERGAAWLDIQMVTPVLEALGAREIPRRAFLSRLRTELARNEKLF